YSIDGGVSWSPQTPHPFVGGAQLAGNAVEQSFTFPGTVHISNGILNLQARIFPSLPGDPDVADEVSKVVLIGSVPRDVLDPRPTGATTSVVAPFNINTSPRSRTQAIYSASELAATGMVAGD